MDEEEEVLRKIEDEGIILRMVNMGGGFKKRYIKDVKKEKEYGMEILEEM